MPITSKIETITPALAKKYLKLNIEKNRQLSPKWVDTIADTMIKGDWLQNGDPVRFQTADENGIEHLLDGQHRLHAIIKNNTPIDMFVVRGLSDRAFLTIDAGKKRTAADVLAIAGYKQSTTLAAAARLTSNYIAHWDFGNRYRAVSSMDVVRIVERFPSLVESCNIGHRGRFIVPGSMLVFLHFLLSFDHKEKIHDFIIQLTDGTGLATGDPILAFRDRMFKYKGANVRLHRETIIGMVFKTWNYTYDNMRIEKLRYAPNENFPILKGFDRAKIFGEDYPVDAYEAQTKPRGKYAPRNKKGNDKQESLFDVKGIENRIKENVKG